MRRLLGFILMVGLTWTAAGCGSGRKPFYDGPKVSSFSGQVLQDGKPVTFPEDEEVVIKFVVTEGQHVGKRFGVPIKPDGTFSIGWMPIGKMAMMLERTAKDPVNRSAGPPSAYTIPGSFTIEEGKTADYVVELGKGWKPGERMKGVKGKTEE